MELDRLEALALSEAATGERERALRELIPGTDEHDFQWCLYHQLRGELDEVDAILNTWAARKGRDARFDEITRRQHLLRYDRDPEATCRYLAEQLRAELHHAAPEEAQEARWPTRLDSKLVSREAFLARALAHHSGLDGVADAGLEWVATQPLSRERVHVLLGRLARPDVPGLVELVLADLEAFQTSFGAHAIHRRLTRAQLDALSALRPALSTDPTFVETYLARLHPHADDPWEHDDDARERYLERLLAFTRPLPAAFHSLKAHVLYHRLALDRRRGRADRALFLEYLAVPRMVAYAVREQLGAFAQSARLDASFDTRLPAVGSDEALVRDYLARFFVEGDEPAAFASYVRADYLERLYAETLLLAGRGEAARWIAILGGAAAEALRDRVDVELAPTTPSSFGAREAVALEVDVKNVRALVVKVFRIQALEHFLRTGRELELGLDLDGLVANEERVETFDVPALLRVRRRIELPSLREPGTYVVELIGNGKSSRALIRKGTLRYVERIGAAGHVLTVLDDEGQIVRGASAWLDGREHRAREDGTIVIPFAASSRNTSIVLSHGAIAAMRPFSHRDERYALAVGFYVDREQLLGGRTAQLVVRPRLHVAGGPASLRLLERARLVVRTRARSGAEASQEIAIAPKDGEELVVPFVLPPDPCEVSVTLRAHVRSTSEQRDVELHESASFAVDTMEATDRIEAVHHAETAAGHVVYLLGKSGDPRAHRAVQFTFRHRRFGVPIQLTLASDAEGRIELGPLSELASFDADLDGARSTHRLEAPHPRWPRSIHVSQGEPIELPWAHEETDAHLAVSLLSVCGAGYREDLGAHAQIDGSVLRIVDLPAGDHRLTVRATGVSVEVRVAAGATSGRFTVSPARMLERDARGPLVVREARVDEDAIVLRVGGATASTRVHVFGTRFVPAPDALAPIARGREAAPAMLDRAPVPSPHVSGRDIGDEARYVLERRHAAKYPGNLLPRPGLLLKPWAVRETTSEVQVAAAAGGFGPPPAPAPRAQAAAKRAMKATGPLAAELTPSLAFLAHGTATVLGLRPDDDGLVGIDRAAFAHASLVRVLIVDEHAALEHRVRLSEVRTPHRDLRLADALDPEVPLARREQHTLLRAGEALVLDPGSKARVYATLADVHASLATVSNDPRVREFEPMVRWNRLDESEKRDFLDRYGCHELHLFLWYKDRAFFDRVIGPHLAHKKEKTFLDEWLLGADLSRWRAPSRYEQLHTLERILLAQRLPEEREATRRRVRDEDDERERELATPVLLQTRSGAPAMAATDEAVEGSAYPAEAFADMESDLVARAETRRLYRAPDTTQEWAETHYWQLGRRDMGPETVPACGFWRDYADHDGTGPFLSARFAETADSLTAMLGALAVLDLPFEATPRERTDAEGRTLLEAETPMVVFHEALTPAAAAEDEAPLLVSQSYVQANDAYRYEGPTRVEKYVRGAMLTHTVYRCQAVIINPTSATRELDVLLQLPEGAIPVENGFILRSERIQLGAHATHSLAYSFYFPQAGIFSHYPATVTREGRRVARAEAARLEVVRTRASGDASWPHVARHGTLEDVCAMLARAPRRELDLSQVLWRLRDRIAYERIVSALEARRFRDERVHAYALLHQDVARTGELLRRQDSFLAGIGRALRSPLLDVEPEDVGYEHLEYEPLVHARAHRLGARLRILDHGLAAQYERFLTALTYRPSLSDEDRLAATYYLLLQDRIAEALAMFARVDPAKIVTRIQYDYLHAYVCFFDERVDEARSIAERYRDYPVERWRKRFAAVLELVEGTGAVVDERDRDEEHARLAASEPALDFTVEGGRLTIRYQAIAACELRVYLVDLELLFSQQPFLRDSGDRFSIVEPNRVIAIELPPGRHEHEVELPPEVRRANTVLELRASGLRRTQTWNASALHVQAVEAYGRIRVSERSTGHALSKIYVKVYARHRNGQIVFHKDGYTDRRGTFDYASLTTGDLGAVERFALLVMSEDHGAELRELAPPP